MKQQHAHDRRNSENKTNGRRRRGSSILSESPHVQVPQDAIFALLGDTAHYLSIVSGLILIHSLITGTTSVEENHHAKWMDEAWNQHGGCLAHKDRPYLSTYHVCCYVDLVAAAMLLFLYQTIGKARGMTRANQLMRFLLVALVMQGLEQGLRAWSLHQHHGNSGDGDIESSWSWFGTSLERNRTTLSYQWQPLPQQQQEQPSLVKQLVWQLPIHLSWGGLVKVALPDLTPWQVSVVSTTAFLVHRLVPRPWQTAWIQLVVLLALSLHQLAPRTASLQEKDFAYATFAWLVLVPTMAWQWIERTQCWTVLQEFGYGHVTTHGGVSGAIFVWYMLGYLHICASVATCKLLKQQQQPHDEPRVQFGGETVRTFERTSRILGSTTVSQAG